MLNKILITGGSGFVGSNLCDFFSANYHVVSTYFTNKKNTDLSSSINSVFLDVRDAESVEDVLKSVEPQIVIHVAGNKNVKECELNPQLAHETNAIGTQNVARSCQKIRAKMIYLSTDLVFPCSSGDYKETDQPQPSLIYGKTKLEGEYLATQEIENLAICRSGGIYGLSSPLLNWLSNQLRKSQQVECFTDVMNTPTYVENLGEMISVILQKDLTGIFHTVGRQKVSRFDFFYSFAQIFSLDTNFLIKTEAGDRRSNMFLHADASLNTEISAQKLGIIFNSVSEGFSRLKLITDNLQNNNV